MAATNLEDEFQRRYVHRNPGLALVVGSKVYKYRKDRRQVYANAIGVDQEAGEGVDVVCDLESWDATRLLLTRPFAHIECWSVLEHSKRPWLLAQTLEKLLVVGGTIHVQVPFVWRVHNYPGDYFRFTPQGVRSLFPNIRWSKIAYATETLQDEDTKLPTLMSKTPHQYISRCEVYAIGTKL